MEFKGTKGKWEYEKDGNSAFFIDSFKSNGSGRLELASIWIEDNSESSEEEALANAKLIAAAPELLEGLKYAKRFLNKEDVDINYIDSIIKKATE